ncbi:MAG: multiheme c-type cytochrome [Rhodospirillaceae bacterium]
MSQKFFAVTSAFYAVFLLNSAFAQNARDIPFVSDEVHLGVASCAGSSCHGALEPWTNSTVLQNEYILWEEEDPHSGAYKTLLTDESQRIAQNLGLGRAEDADMCLDCHADNVPVERRAKGFQISDGVGCEACHGGAVNWLGRHISGEANHAANLAAGLYPSEDPVARAKLCLSCHFGTKDRFITHRIMGAGHPRLAFELDTYTWTQPGHFEVDEDYKSRKGNISSVQVWAIGQAVAVDSLLEAMLDPKRNRDGIFPELVFFDCHACHHPMSNVRWVPRDSHEIGPGIPRIYDANLIMMQVLLKRVDPEMASNLAVKSKALHQASLQGYDAVIKAAGELKEATQGVIDQLAAYTFTAADTKALLVGLMNEGLSGEYVDYAAAEQATMAASAMLQTMVDDKMISQAQYIELSGVLNDCYAAIEKDEEYNPRQFLAALQNLQRAMPSL